MAEPISCEVCGAAMRPRATWISQCSSCSYLGSTLRPGAGTGIEGLEQLRRRNFEHLLDRLAILKPLEGATLLEVGSAWGWFLEAAALRGIRAHGIEPEEANARKSQALGHSVETGYFPDDLRNPGPYDIIVFNDVFEHIPGPSGLVRKIEKQLAPNGLLVINLPSSNGTLYRLGDLLDRLGMHGPFERLWQKGFPSPHVSYFNPKNLGMLIERQSGLRCEAVLALQTIMREGLGERIASSHPGLVGKGLLAGTWLLSFVLPRLPPDIVVSIFRKSG